MIKLIEFQSVGIEIRQIRERLQLSQKELAILFNRRAPRSIHTTRSSICRYEKNIVDPPASTLIKFLTLDRS